MQNSEILRHIDHTLLKPTATHEQITQLCREAVEYNTASVCIPSCFVAAARGEFPTLNICTVVGFPLGYCNTAAKCAETHQALKDGADEIDMVVNLTAVKDADWQAVAADIAAVRAECSGHVLKVIVETCYLDETEKTKLCGIVSDCGADYIKTSTGFGTAGATLADVELFKKHIASGVKIKAAGGIRTREDMETFLAAGCERLGSSAAVTVLCKSK